MTRLLISAAIVAAVVWVGCLLGYQLYVMMIGGGV